MLCKLQKDLIKQRGIGLLELMLSIAIISVLLIMATRYYQNATQGKDISNSVSILGGIIAAETQYSSMNGGYIGGATWQTVLNLPTAVTISPWDGGAVDASGTTAEQVKVTMTGVPATVCTNFLTPMLTKNTGAAVTCPSTGTGSVTVTYS